MKNRFILVLFIVMLPMIPAISHADSGPRSSNNFNPAISFIVEGRYASYDEGHSFELPGFQLASDEGIYAKGFSTGHNELNFFAKLSDSTSGFFHTSIETHDGSTEIDIEEGYIESSVLGNGLNFKAGQFFSAIGIYNEVHEHRQAFADVPLVYVAMFNTHLVDTGVQLSWKYKSALNLDAGIEVTTGTSFPGGETTSEANNKGRVVFIKLGDNDEHHFGWQTGLSFYSSDFNSRTGEQVAGEGSLEVLNGTTDVTGFDVALTFSPNGHDSVGQTKVQLEYFQRDEDGEIEYTELTDLSAAGYKGEQTGLYLQAVYRLSLLWSVGFRYDLLEADNTLSNFDGDVDLAGLVLSEEDTGLIAEKDPTRSAIVVDYSPNPLGTIRLQFMKDESGHESENRIYIQYLASIGGKKH